MDKSLYNFHNSPLAIAILDFIFKINKFNIVNIKENKAKKKQYFPLGFVAIFWLLFYFWGAKKRSKYRTDLALDRRVILGGNNLIFILEKIKE